MLEDLILNNNINCDLMEGMMIINMKKIKYFKTYEIADLKDMLYKMTKKNEKKVAFRVRENDKIQVKTFSDFKSDVEKMGTKLLDIGLQNKRIAIIGKNSYEWATSYLAATIIAVVVPIDKECKKEAIIEFLNKGEVDCVIADTKYLDIINKSKDEVEKKNIILIDINNKNKYLNYINFIKEGDKLIAEGDKRFEEIKINPNEMKILLFTSGTTGNSKAVMLSHENICSNIISIASIVKVDNSTSVLSILPLHHTYECTIGFLLVLYGGGNIAFCDGLKYISKNILEYKPTFILCVPLLLENVYKKILKSLKESLPSKYIKKGENLIDNIPFFLKPIVKRKIKKSLGGKIKTFIVGAAKINANIVTDYFKLGIKVLQGYGLTECSPLVAGNNDTCYKAESCGMPIPNVKYKILKPNKEGIGEIVVQGPNVMIGYYKDEKSTKNAIKDGWFYTGDLGYMDEDEFLYITGRNKNMILTKNGENIYPEEIEEILNENELITESLVVGEYNGKDDVAVKAKILPNIDALREVFGNKIPSKEEIRKIFAEIIKKVNSKLPNYKHIRSFKIMNQDFERTTTNKIKRYGKNIEEDKN